MYKTVYTEVEVEVDISDFETVDLIDELDRRGDLPPDSDESAKDLINAIWFKRRNGNTDYQSELDQLIYQVLGKIL